MRFLSALNKRWDKYGIDVSKYALKYVKKNYNYKVFKGHLKDAAYDNNFFDVVQMSHVIEHIQKPITTRK